MGAASSLRILVAAALSGYLLHHGDAAILKQKRDDVPAPYVAKGYYPAPHGGWAESWADSYAKAQAFVEQMTLVEKANITAGTGFYMGESIRFRVEFYI